MTTLRHPNVVHLYEVFDEDPKCFLVTEFCEGGELLQRILNSVHEESIRVQSDEAKRKDSEPI